MSCELYKKYKEDVVPKLLVELKKKNRLDAPKMLKLVVHTCIGENAKDSAVLQYVEKNMKSIAGQKVLMTKSKHSISNFKVRKGMLLGMKVTLRGCRMYDFVYKLVNLVLPRVRDFAGVSTDCIDKQGNLNLGFKDQIPFLEIGAEGVEKLHGLEISIVSSAKNKEEAISLFKLLGFPFKEFKKK